MRKTVLTSLLVLGALSVHSQAQIVQTAGQSTGGSDWNSADWGTPPSVPTAANSYITNSALGGSTDTTFGVNTTSYLRIFDAATNTFGGGSLEVTSGERLLDKALTGDGASANLTLDGGSNFDEAANAAGATFLSGTLTIGTGVATIGVNQTGTSSLAINSTLAGAGTLDLFATNGLTPSTITLAGSINGFTGLITTASAGTYGITTNALAPNGKLNISAGTFDLSGNLTLGALTVTGTTFAPGVYTAATIDAAAGGTPVVDTTATGLTGTITVVPEPNAWAMMAAGLGLLVGVQRMRRQVS